MQVALDGYALRFPRTGIVSYSYAVAKGYQQRLGDRRNLKILLGDRNVTDKEIEDFLRKSYSVPIFDDHKETFIERVRRKLYNDPFSNSMPGLNSAIQQSTRNCDVFHSVDWFMYPSRTAKVNAITYFDLTPMLFPEFHEDLNIAKEKCKLNALAKYDFAFCISESTRNDLLKYSDISPDRVIVNYIDTDDIYNLAAYKSRDEITAKYGIPDGFKYLLAVSTIEPRKNFKKVLEAFSAFRGKNPGEPYVLVCSGLWGWKNDELKDYLAKCGCGDRVIFTGFADNTDLPSLYHHADCFLYLSLYEGFGLPILEAMKSGCPVVCSNTSSMPEVIGDTGILVSPHDTAAIVGAIEAIAFNPATSATMRERAFERCKLFSWNKHMDTLFRWYMRVI